MSEFELGDAFVAELSDPSGSAVSLVPQWGVSSVVSLIELLGEFRAGSSIFGEYRR
jgi:hypothetical protein